MGKEPKILLKISYAYFQLSYELEEFDPNTIESIVESYRKPLQENPLGIEANPLALSVPLNIFVIERDFFITDKVVWKQIWNSKFTDNLYEKQRI